MIKNINDIAYLIKPLSEFIYELTNEELSAYIYRKPYLIHQIDYDKLLNFSKEFNLIKIKNNKLSLTKHGLIINKMYKSNIDLSNEQKKYIIQNCLMYNKNIKNIRDFIIHFKYHDMNTTLKITKERSQPFINEISILFQLGFINSNDGYWLINEEYIEFVEQFQKNVERPMTQLQLDEILQEQKIIGNMAEELTMKYENKRLKKLGWIYESQNIQRISTQYVNRGYDIESFSLKNNKRNLFIEVKGRKWNLTSFIMSINEIKIAKKLKDRYVIYFWNNLGCDYEQTEPYCIIPNPIKNLSIHECENCLSYMIDVDDLKKIPNR